MPTSTEARQLLVAHPVDVDAAHGTAQRQRRDHDADRLAGRVGTRVLDAPRTVLLPVDGV